VSHPGTGGTGRPDVRPARAWGAFAGCSLIWGSTFLFISIGNDALAPLWAATLRLTLASLLLGLLARILRHPFPRGRALRAALGYGFLQFGVNFALLYWGQTSFPSGLSAVFYATVPLTTALMTSAWGMERLTRAKLAGTSLALAGVALIFSDRLMGRLEIVPALAVFVAATCAAGSGVVLKRGPRQSPVWSNAVGSMTGLVVCLGVSFAAGEPHPFPSRFEAWFPVVYLTLAGSLGAFVLFAWLINHWPVTRVTFVGVVSSMVALVLGWLFRDEQLTLANLGGSALVIAGVVLGLRATASETAAAPPGARPLGGAKA
jgi:drug/metabolite transporter (DMT)-like permease